MHGDRKIIRQKLVARSLAGVLLATGCVALFFLLSSSDWGPPGSNAYLTYEARNRLIPLSLLFVGAGIVTGYLTVRSNMGRLGRLSFVLSTSGVAMMLVGNVAEFWLFSGLPYGPMNARAAAWSLFLLGGLVLLFGLTLFMVALGRSETRQ